MDPYGFLIFEFSKVHYEFARDGFILTATADSHPVVCAVSRAALEAFSGSSCDPDEPLTLYKEWETQMRNLMSAKHRRGGFEPDGSVVVRSGDIAALMST